VFQGEKDDVTAPDASAGESAANRALVSPASPGCTWASGLPAWLRLVAVSSFTSGCP
jgi:hypothetical protein